MFFAPPPAVMPPAAIAAPSMMGSSTAAPHGWESYTVKAGETLYDLAPRFRTTPGELAARNNIRNARSLWAGAQIQVPRLAPQPAPATQRTARRASTPAPRRAETHVVRSGETLFDLAARYRTTIPALAKANRIDPKKFIFPGQRLIVRIGGAARSTPRTAYVVRAGDTLFEIAPRLGTTPTALMKANALRSAMIYPGQKLAVPGKASRSAPRPQSAAPLPNTFMGVRYPDKVVRSAARNRAVLAQHAVPNRTQTKDLIAVTARRHGVDPRLAQAIALQESGWNQRQVSVANAIGIMQVIPAGGDWASSLIGHDLNLLNPQDNVTAGVVMLRALARATGSEQLAIASYYQGLGSVQSRGMYSDTERYVANVTALKARM